LGGRRIRDRVSGHGSALVPARDRTPRPGSRPSPGLHDRQEIALRTLLDGGTHTDAAREAGVRRATVSEWVNHHGAFRAELARQRDELRDAVRGRLEAAAGEAVEVLRALLGDPNARTRLQAAKAILAHVGDLTEGASEDLSREDMAERLTRVVAAFSRPLDPRLTGEVVDDEDAHEVKTIAEVVVERRLRDHGRGERLP